MYTLSGSNSIIFIYGSILNGERMYSWGNIKEYTPGGARSLLLEQIPFQRYFISHGSKHGPSICCEHYNVQLNDASV